MSELYDNLLRATDNINDITNEKYATVTKIEGKLVSVKEENSELEHSNVPVLNNVKLELGDKVVIGFVDNSIYNPILIGSLEHNSSSGDDVSWEEIVNKPSTFTPSAHNHNYEDINNAPIVPTKTSDLTNDSGFLTEHQSLTNYIQKNQISGLVKNDGTIDTTPYLSSLPIHNHDDRYYTESEIDDLLNDKLDVEDAFSGSYNDLTNVPSTFTPSNHNHSISDINNLQSSLNSKLETTDVGEAALTNDYEDLDNLPTLFDGNYNSLSNKPSTFTPSEHNHSDLDVRIDSALPNLGLSVDEKQTNVNLAIDTAIGNLSSIKAINVVSTKPTASSTTMGKLYIISENNKVNVYYTEENNGSYSWHKMDADILDDLSIDWSDIQNNPFSSASPSDYATSSHSHGNITSDGKIGSSSGYLLITSTDGTITSVQSTSSSKIKDPNAHNNIATLPNSTQSVINTRIDTVLGDKANTSDLGAVALSNSYDDLENLPTLFSGDYDDLVDKPAIPSKTSDLQNDSGFITSSSLPTKTSDLTNDGDGTNAFLTQHQSLSNYVQKSNTSGLIKNDGSIDTTQYLSSLPSHNHDDRYYTESEMDDLLDEKLDVGDAFSGSYNDLTNVPMVFTPDNHKHIASDIDYYYEEGGYAQYDTLPDYLSSLNTRINGKQDSLVSGTNIKTINNQSLLGSGNINIQGGGSGASNIFDLDPTSQYGDTVVEEGVDRDGSGLGYGNDFLIYNSQEQKFYYDKNSNADNDIGNELATLNDLPSVPTTNEIVNMIYPIGSIYMSVNSTSPSVLFGGTWTQLEDTFLLACGSTYASDGSNVHTAQHGEASHTLTSAESGQKNLGTITSTGGDHKHNVGTAQYLTAPTSGNGVTRNSTAGQSGTKVNNLLQCADGVTRYSPPSSGSLSVTTTISGSDATSSHNNMPPYLAVYMWKRTA